MAFGAARVRQRGGRQARTRFARVTRFLTVLLLAAFIAPSFASVLSAQTRNHEQALPGGLDGQVLICTGNGIKLISLDDEGNAVPSGERMAGAFCALCMLPAAPGLIAFNGGGFVFAALEVDSGLVPPVVHANALRESEHPPVLSTGPPALA